MALRLLTPVTGSLTATQPCGTTFHHSCPLTSAYVFLIRFILFILHFILLMVIFKGLLVLATTPTAIAQGPPPLPMQEG